MNEPVLHPRHIVAACALVTNAEDAVLMIRSPRRGWEVPGGQVEMGESLLDGLRREILEETGITAEIGKLASVSSSISEPCKVIFSFRAQATGGELRTSIESPEVAWIPRSDVLAMIEHPAVRDRVSNMLRTGNGVIYRVYTLRPYTILSEQLV